jgi:hypothetical protein
MTLYSGSVEEVTLQRSVRKDTIYRSIGLPGGRVPEVGRLLRFAIPRVDRPIYSGTVDVLYECNEDER